MTPDIRYEDAHLLIAVKPCGMLSEDNGEESLPAVLRRHTGGDIYPVHRLDRTTQGVILYAKTQQAAKALSMMIQNREIEKTYLAVAEDVPDPAQGEMNDLLFFDRRRNKSYIVSRERKGVKSAQLSYTTLATAKAEERTVSLLRIRLHTGRTHQIRVQLSSRKMPLCGDRRYGSTIRAENIALCSHALRFTHPITGEPIAVTYTPDDGMFALFSMGA